MQSLTKSDIVIFVDTKEPLLLNMLKLPQSGITYEIVVGTLDVADILICVKTTDQDMLSSVDSSVGEKRKESSSDECKNHHVAQFRFE